MAEMVTVKCTKPWWHNDTFHEAGSVIKVPKGTAVPQGFFVDGVMVPIKEKVRYAEVLEIQDLRQEDLDLRQEVLTLKKQLAAKTKELAAKEPVVKKVTEPVHGSHYGAGKKEQGYGRQAD